MKYKFKKKVTNSGYRYTIGVERVAIISLLNLNSMIYNFIR